MLEQFLVSFASVAVFVFCGLIFEKIREKNQRLSNRLHTRYPGLKQYPGEAKFYMQLWSNAVHRVEPEKVEAFERVFALLLKHIDEVDFGKLFKEEGHTLCAVKFETTDKDGNDSRSQYFPRFRGPSVNRQDVAQEFLNAKSDEEALKILRRFQSGVDQKKPRVTPECTNSEKCKAKDHREGCPEEYY